jgi:hypothetical protein
MLNNVILCLSVCGTKTKGPPMVSRFLLHDPSNMSIGGVSGERKLSIWGRVLEWHSRHQEAFCILQGLLSKSVPLKRFGPSLQEISQRSHNSSTVGQKAAVKVYHAKKTLQLLGILRGWAVSDFGSMIGRGGRSCRRNRVSINF